MAEAVETCVEQSKAETAKVNNPYRHESDEEIEGNGKDEELTELDAEAMRIMYIGQQADCLIGDTMIERQSAISRNNRIFQSRFREVVRQMYPKCVITFANIDECQICHILPWSKCGSRAENSAYNAIVLRSDLHKTFDDHIWAINPNTLRIEMRHDCKGKGYAIEKHDGEVISFFNIEKSREFLSKRYRMFLDKMDAISSLQKIKKDDEPNYP